MRRTACGHAVVSGHAAISDYAAISDHAAISGHDAHSRKIICRRHSSPLRIRTGNPPRCAQARY